VLPNVLPDACARGVVLKAIRGGKILALPLQPSRHLCKGPAYTSVADVGLCGKGLKFRDGLVNFICWVVADGVFCRMPVERGWNKG